MLTLLYHNILCAPEDRWPVAYRAVTLSIFEGHVRRLRKHLLHPAEVHEQIVKGREPKGVLITFDDGASGILEAARVLARHGKTGVAFVCPGAVKEGLWFYRLGDALVRASQERLRWQEHDLSLGTASDRRRAYKTLSTYLFPLPARDRDAQLSEIIAQAQPVGEGPHPNLTILDEEGLRRTAETGGMIFANHTWSHPNLTTLPPEELSREIGDAEAWLQVSGLPTLPWFAFPRGEHDARVREAVAQAGLVAFAATPYEPVPSVWPRTGLYAMDGHPLRFALKTAFGGRLLRLYERRRAQSRPVV